MVLLLMQLPVELVADIVETVTEMTASEIDDNAGTLIDKIVEIGQLGEVNPLFPRHVMNGIMRQRDPSNRMSRLLKIYAGDYSEKFQNARYVDLMRAAAVCSRDDISELLKYFFKMYSQRPSKQYVSSTVALLGSTAQAVLRYYTMEKQRERLALELLAIANLLVHPLRAQEIMSLEKRHKIWANAHENDLMDVMQYLFDQGWVDRPPCRKNPDIFE